MKCLTAVAALAGLLVLAGGVPAKATDPQTLVVYGAGTLAVPFRQIDKLFEQEHPGVTVQPEFGGSVKIAKRITELHHRADVIGVADYRVIPKYLFGTEDRKGYATWYAGFARNAITFAYTDKSKFAHDITPQNWYEVLARPGVEIGRSNPDTDPSGYQTVQMLTLAQADYGKPGLVASVLANAPLANVRDTETSLLSALQLGQIDYLGIYRSDAIQHHLHYIHLPPKIDLSSPEYAAEYKKAVVHTKNGDLTAEPIVYAVTIPTNAEHAALARQYVDLLLGPKGQAIMEQCGFTAISPAYGVHTANMPKAIQAAVKPWPAG